MKKLIVTVTVDEKPIKRGETLVETKWDYKFEGCSGSADLIGLFTMIKQISAREINKRVEHNIKEDQTPL